MKNKKLIIISPGTLAPTRGGYSIAHHLRENGFRAECFSFFEFLNQNKIDAFFNHYFDETTVLGISNTFSINDFNKNIKYLSQLAKKNKIPIILGGVHSNNDLEYDHDLRGSYAEDHLIQFLNTHYDAKLVKNYSLENDNFRWTGNEAFPSNLTLPVEISRHCVFNCKFCSYPNRGQKGANRNMDLLKQELDGANSHYNTKTFILLCSTFNDSKLKLDNFFKSIENRNYTFAAFIRLDLLMQQKEFWPLFKKHIKHMTFGIETFNHKSGLAIGKGTRPSVVKEWLKEVRDYFDDCFIYSAFIVGLPYSNPQEHWADLDFLTSENLLDGYYWNPLYLDEIASKNYNSYFDSHIENYGYQKTYHTFGPTAKIYDSKVGWSREDGFDFIKASQLSIELNNQTKRSPSPFLTVMLSQKYTSAEIKNMKISGTVNVDYKACAELDLLSKEIKSSYWSNVLKNV